MIRRRSCLNILNLNGFFFFYTIKKFNKPLLKFNRNFFFSKRRKLLKRKFKFNYFSFFWVLNSFLFLFKSVLKRVIVLLHKHLSIQIFFWFGLVVNKVTPSCLLIFFFYSFLIFNLKILKSDGFLLTTNSYYLSLNSLKSGLNKTITIYSYLIIKRVFNFSFFNIFNLKSLVNFYLFSSLLS